MLYAMHRRPGLVKAVVITVTPRNYRNYGSKRS